MKSNSTENIKLNEQMITALRQCVLLQPLEAGDFDALVANCHAKQLTENRILFDQGAPLTDIYLLISGSIKLLRLAPSGDEKVFEIIRPGQTFAEAVLFSGGARYPVSAVTVSPSVVVAIHAASFLQLLNSSNTLCLNLMAKLSQRLHWMVNEVDRLTLHNATFRLVCYLLSHISEDENDRRDVNLSVPKNVIASRLSITPETLSRSLKELSNQGLINLDGPQIDLVDIEKLRQLISL
jgi:CRP-like cAMP-binding protein